MLAESLEPYSVKEQTNNQMTWTFSDIDAHELTTQASPEKGKRFSPFPIPRPDSGQGSNEKIPKEDYQIRKT